MKSASLILSVMVVAAVVVGSGTAMDITSGVGGKCMQQMREQEDKLEHCSQYMSEGVPTCGRCSAGSNNQECCARECCSALERMDDDCACHTVKALAEKATRTTARSLGMRTAARQLTTRCGLSDHCSTAAVFV